MNSNHSAPQPTTTVVTNAEAIFLSMGTPPKPGYAMFISYHGTIWRLNHLKVTELFLLEEVPPTVRLVSKRQLFKPFPMYTG